MNAPINLATAAMQARVMSAALSLGQRIDLWSLALFVLAVYGLMFMSLSIFSVGWLSLSIFVGSVQKICALRVAFDHALVSNWAHKWDSEPTATSNWAIATSDFDALDQMLIEYGMRPASEGSGRDLASRLKGALGLLKLQCLALAIQLIAVVIAALL